MYDAEPAKRREFAEVKTQVLDLWREQRQREENEKYFATLLKKYDVVMDEESETARRATRQGRSPGQQAICESWE